MVRQVQTWCGDARYGRQGQFWSGVARCVGVRQDMAGMVGRAKLGIGELRLGVAGMVRWGVLSFGALC